MGVKYYEDDAVTLYHGDCLDVLVTLDAGSVDAVVTDPPYGLGFMGRAWDSLPPGEEWARECLRVLKPGGHLLAFGGSRTWHRLAVAVEDAGFEIRDSIAWLYGSGFPKSLDVSKAIDKAQEGEMRRAKLAHFVATRGVGAEWLVAQGVADAKSLTDWTTEGHTPSDRNWRKIRDALGVTADEESAFEREVTGSGSSGKTYGMGGIRGVTTSIGEYDITAPATDAARTWQGWGTALKPAFEPIVVARKPLSGTVAANVLTHGTGALNIDGCRIDMSDADRDKINKMGGFGSAGWDNSGSLGSGVLEGRNDGSLQALGAKAHDSGRWPANVILDETQAAELDQQGGDRRPSGHYNKTNGTTEGRGAANYKPNISADTPTYDDQGGASRFFYTAKAPTDERITHNGTAHPTVKPLSLMRWLVRLVTPPGGTILEPFAGSGTTVEAAILERFRCIAIEREAEYLPLITQRINRRRDPVAYLTEAGDDLGLFDEAAS